MVLLGARNYGFCGRWQRHLRSGGPDIYWAYLCQEGERRLPTFPVEILLHEMSWNSHFIGIYGIFGRPLHQVLLRWKKIKIKLFLSNFFGRSLFIIIKLNAKNV